MDVKLLLLLLLACAPRPESLIFSLLLFTLNPTLTKLLKAPSPHKLILFVRGKQLCSLRRTWTKICSLVRFIVFGSILVPSLLCLPSALFFFAVWAQEESTLLCSHSDIFDSYQKQDLTSPCSELNICCVFLLFSLRLPPVPILSHPSVFVRTNILLDSFRFSIYGWAHNEGHCCNGSHQEIAAVPLWLGCCQL